MATAPASQRNEEGRKDEEGEDKARESEKEERLGEAEREGETDWMEAVEETRKGVNHSDEMVINGSSFPLPLALKVFHEHSTCINKHSTCIQDGYH